MVDRSLKHKILKIKGQFPVLTILGPQQSGKTTLAKETFPSYRYVNLELPEEQEFASNDARGFLGRFEHDEGVILDEIQKAPDLLSYLQVEVDERPRPDRFILTSSQNILLNQHISQTLAGRVALLTLLPLSIEEVRMANMLPTTSSEAIFQGFYPRVIQNHLDPVLFSESYLRTYVERDVRDIKQITSLSDFQKFMRLCAGRIGQLLNLSSLANEASLSFSTVKSWLSVLEASYIIFLLQPHHVNFNKRLVKMPKLYFYDTSLACSLLRLTNADDVEYHYLRGGLFESMILSDFLKKRYHHALPPNVYFWRDKNGREVDAILEEGLRTVPVEIKSGTTLNSEMFEGLAKWAELAKTPQEDGLLVYGGAEEQKRKQGHAFPWRLL
jgi:hypothetical protein